MRDKTAHLPLPKPTLTLTSHLRQNVGPGEKCWPDSQESIMIQDHYTFLGNCPSTPPLSQHNTCFSLREKYWFRGGVGGQIPRNV